MASGHITALQIEGEKVEVVRHFLFLGSKITGDDDCSHEIRRWLLLGKKAMTNLDSVLKSRDTANKSPNGLVWLWQLDLKKGQNVEELMPLNCGSGEDSWKFLQQEGDQTSQS